MPSVRQSTYRSSSAFAVPRLRRHPAACGRSIQFPAVSGLRRAGPGLFPPIRRRSSSVRHLFRRVRVRFRRARDVFRRSAGFLVRAVSPIVSSPTFDDESLGFFARSLASARLAQPVSRREAKVFGASIHFPVGPPIFLFRHSVFLFCHSIFSSVRGVFRQVPPFSGPVRPARLPVRDDRRRRRPRFLPVRPRRAPVSASRTYVSGGPRPFVGDADPSVPARRRPRPLRPGTGVRTR